MLPGMQAGGAGRGYGRAARAQVSRPDFVSRQVDDRLLERYVSASGCGMRRSAPGCGGGRRERCARAGTGHLEDSGSKWLVVSYANLQPA
jgi:hypothetical protein